MSSSNDDLIEIVGGIIAGIFILVGIITAMAFAFSVGSVIGIWEDLKLWIEEAFNPPQEIT